MKNIHKIPTDKPSKLLYNHTLKSFCFQKEENGMFVNDGKVSGASFWSIEKAQHNGFCPQHIYITSDEEFDEYNFVINSMGKIESVPNSKWGKKIILTTDLDLIADGVQAIDDDFLQWFVKNPSCEEVGVTFGCLEERQCGCDSNARCLKPGYKIIIPKEEPKQIKCYCGHTTMCDCSPIEEPKQETIEEVAENIKRSDLYKSIYSLVNQIPRKDVESDAMDASSCAYEIEQLLYNHAVKTLYTEEEVMDMFHNLSMHLPLHYEVLVKEQFKKK